LGLECSDRCFTQTTPVVIWRVQLPDYRFSVERAAPSLRTVVARKTSWSMS
jgi:hypothetical protein